ncbi:hypothetical protein [Actinacidiphila acididurans]|uniref:Uncharacterized protein n=1 Tax=Actinacidiphila acididurans TaxID=2784346 RepID=A0ABS2U2I5_9ACTN|nr:hypothetical protein [Actinacidiphila acididurans]MBM9509562.1 hypothetical protein [Actinacidiphila acididurans]
MDLAAQLAEVDRLRRLPFPAQRVREGAVVGGPGFHIEDLAVSEDFHDSDPARRAEAEEDFTVWCQALVDLLGTRWGEPETVDLYAILIRSMDGEEVPAPLDELCGYVPEMYGWLVGERWIALGVGQWDGGLPLQLVLAVGERTAYERAVRPGPGAAGGAGPAAADGPRADGG